ncbi:MAG: geranylgeranyl reductase family protein [Bacteroidetes bacterium]|nr:geranylgeranyl reductase family protein [Bacteroidota bacterium]
MTKEVFDVLIVGSGPAGCGCALTLYRKGLKIALIDKEDFPRDKVCGDAIPGPFFKTLDKINPHWGQLMRELVEKSEIRASRAIFSNGKSFTINWKTYSYNSPRFHFDDYLRQMTIAETDTKVLPPDRLKQIRDEGNCLVCTFASGRTYAARLVIGADGANSVAKRFIPNQATGDQMLAASVRAYVSGIEGLEPATNECFYLKQYLPGYLWIFPLADGTANIGFGMEMKQGVDQERVNLKTLFVNILKEEPLLASRCKNMEFLSPIKGFGLPMYHRDIQISGNRVLLCGDAASLIDPLSGHGIDYAFISGHLAALQAIACFTNNNFTDSFLSAYDQAVYKTIGPDLRKSKNLAQCIGRFPFLLDWFSKWAQNKRLLNWFVKIGRI